MQDITPDIISELKCYYLGALSVPRQVWFSTREDEPILALSGQNIVYRNEQWNLNIGSIPSIGIINRQVCIKNISQFVLTISVNESDNEWISWKLKKSNNQTNYGESVTIDISFESNQQIEHQISCTMNIHVKYHEDHEKIIPLNVVIDPCNDFPYADIQFNGNDLPDIHHFGTLHPFMNKKVTPYLFFAKNKGSQTLKLYIEDCSEWLTIQEKQNDNTRLEFEIPSGKTLELHIFPKTSPQFMDYHYGIIQFKSNDVREDFKAFNLEFEMQQQIEGPYVQLVEPPSPIEMISTSQLTFNVQLYNWGNEQALIEIRHKKKRLTKCKIPGSIRAKRVKYSIPINRSLKNVSPGKYDMFFLLSVKNGKQNDIKIPLRLTVIKIEPTINIVDFGTVNFSETKELRISFNASDDRALLMKAQIAKELTDNIAAEALDNTTFKLILKKFDISEKPLISFNHKGIAFVDELSDYSIELPVVFHRLTPKLTLSQQMIDLGDVIRGSNHMASFYISNTGDGLLEIQIKKYSGLKIIDSTEFSIPPGQKEKVTFQATFQKNIIHNEIFDKSIILTSNEPDTTSVYKIQITANVLSVKGILCPTCQLVLPFETPYCALCGDYLKNAKFVDIKNVVKCSICGFEYHSQVQYCPNDGNPLKPLEISIEE